MPGYENGDAVPEGTVMLKDNMDGTVVLQGPGGQVFPYHTDNLSDGDLKRIGYYDQRTDAGERVAPVAPAGAPAPVAPAPAAAPVQPQQPLSPWLAQPRAVYSGFADAFNRNKTSGPDAPSGDQLSESQHPGYGAAGQALGALAGGANTLISSPQTVLKHIVPEAFGGNSGAAAQQLLPTLGRPGISPGQLTPPDAGAAQPGGQGMPAGPPGRPPTEIPRMQLHGGGGPLAPDYAQQYGAASDAEGKALANQADIEGKMVGEKAGAQRTAADQQMQAYQQAMQHRQAVETEYRGHLEQLDKAQAALDAQKEDPNHLWNSFSGGQKAAAVISQVLAGFASGFTGHQVTSAYDKMSQADIEAQRNNYMRARDSLASKRTAYAQLREQGISDTDATLMLKINHADAGLRSLTAQVDEQNAPADVKARALAQAAELQKSKAQAEAALKQSAAATAHERVATAAESQTMGIQRDQHELQKKMLANGQLPPAMAERAVRLPNGGFVLAGDKGGKEKLEMVARGTNDVNDAIEQMKQVVKQNPVDVLRPGSEANRKYNLLKDQYINSVNPSMGLNQQMQEPTRELYSKGIDPTALGSTEALVNALENARQRHLHSANNAFQMETGQTVFAEAPQSLQPLR